MSITKMIPLASVKAAMLFAKLRRVCSPQVNGKAHARCAAFTQNPHLNIACREAVRGHRPYPFQQHHFAPMHAGDLAQLVERTRLHHGLAEVRKTGGMSLRAIQADLKGGSGVMR